MVTAAARALSGTPRRHRHRRPSCMCESVTVAKMMTGTPKSMQLTRAGCFFSIVRTSSSFAVTTRLQNLSTSSAERSIDHKADQDQGDDAGLIFCALASRGWRKVRSGIDTKCERAQKSK